MQAKKTKAKKRTQASDSGLRASGRSSKNHSEAVIPKLEAQIAALEEKIAMLQGEASDSGLQASGFGLQEEAPNTHSEVRSQKSEARPKIGPPLGTPVIEDVTPIGSRFVRVTWSPVTNAGGYVVRYSTDETFATNVNAVNVDNETAAVTLNGLQANTTYYVSVKTLGNGTSIDSPFSVAKSAVTGITTDDETAVNLQNWFDEQQTLFQNFALLVPELETTVLTTAERRRLLGSGVRRYGFIEKVSDVSQDFPQFWPASVHGSGAAVDIQDKLTDRVREIEVLRNLLVWLRYVSRVVGDLLLIMGDDAFRMANMYYSTVRSASRSNLPKAGQVFQMLQLFWRRRRRAMDEPTEHEIERDARALLRGTKVGNISIRNESDQVVRGEKVFVDNTVSAKQHGGVKVMERGEIRD